MENSSHRGLLPFIFIASAWRQCHDGNKMFCLEGHTSAAWCVQKEEEEKRKPYFVGLTQAHPLLWLHCHPRAEPAQSRKSPQCIQQFPGGTPCRSTNVKTQLTLVPLACRAFRKHDALLRGSLQGCLGVVQTRRKWCICVCAATVHRANISRHSSNNVQLIAASPLWWCREDSNAASDDSP